jgi:hypothetical protein
MPANLIGLIVFQSAGVGSFVGDSDLRKIIEKCPALNLELACQVVNANLTHSVF